ncbi:MAG TPA: hypothetical protein VLM41_02350 [Steroidobacteraceae bacterium]|nr:hypothetical protein [Steroidobacteraceae bacterium]
MHARIDQLLSLRDGEPVDAEVLRHVSRCPECSASLQRAAALAARLRSLPVERSRSGWEGVRQRLAQQERRRERSRRQARVIAGGAAAAMLIMLGSRFIAPGLVVSDGPAQSMAAAGAVPGPHASLEELKGRSRELERLLAVMPARPAVERADTAVPIDSLEARVQWLDHQLSLGDDGGRDAGDSENLWRDRVEAMDALVRLRYVEAQRIML